MIVALAGGVGGAKLAHGLALSIPPEDLTVVINTADDFRLYGLYISPDIDTVMYTLAGIANPQTGWGVQGDTTNALEMIARYGRDTWFLIGDRDLATHVLRTELLSSGRTITQVTSELATALGVRSKLLPMCNEPVSTTIFATDGRVLEFQEYFVRYRHEPEVAKVEFAGIDRAQATQEVLSAIRSAELIIFCPSNPFVSIGPILSVRGVREAIDASSAPKVAVSPIVGGSAIKGPAADMMRSMGFEVSPLGIAKYYRGIVNGIVIDNIDADLEENVRSLGLSVLVTNTIMNTVEDRQRLARELLAFGSKLMSEVSVS